MAPRRRRGVTPQMAGRYPDFDVLEQAEHWDEATRRVVLQRLEVGDELSFFTPAEEPVARAFCDAVLAQHHEPRVPVVELVDRKLARGELDGYQYADMPDDRDTWRVVLRGLDETARALHGAAFAACDVTAREDVVARFAALDVSGGAWAEVNVRRAWTVVMRHALEAFYSHPWAWNEIGFGGPAYPRGFMRTTALNPREPYETPATVAPDPGRKTRAPGT